MFFTYTFDSGSVIFVIECSPWQSVHTGDSAIPARIPFPCTERSYSSRMPEWHFPHSVGMFCRWVAERGWSPGRVMWFPWQSGQTAAPRGPGFFLGLPGTSCPPCACTIPWVLWEYDFSASGWHVPHVTAVSFPCGAFASVWHDMHVPFPWTDCRNSFSSTNSDRVFRSGRDFSIVLSP